MHPILHEKEPTMTSNPLNQAHSDIERLARRRAGAKVGWYVHAFIYVLVNLGLVALSFAGGQSWAVYPLAGWGLGLLIHGVMVWFVAFNSGLRERLVERERRLLGGRDRR